MTSVCLYFKVHQSYRLKKYQPGDIDLIHCYEDAEANRAAVDLAADSCYLPANKILLRTIRENKGKFKAGFSISGTTMELLQEYRPDVIASFRELVETGCVEILAETYYHSLSFLYSRKEFQRQVEKHSLLVKELFGQELVIFRNTELIYHNDLAKLIAGLGYKGLLCEGSERILKGRTVNKIYAAPGSGDFGLLLRNRPLSDAIAFRSYDSYRKEKIPLTADRFAARLHADAGNEEVINLCMDYETFGIHQKEESGIFDFLDALPAAVLSGREFLFSTPSRVLHEYYPCDIYHVTQTISREDNAGLNCAWCENVMQHNMLKKIYSLENLVYNNHCIEAMETWGRLQAADHFYDMREKTGVDNTHQYPNPYPGAKEAYQHYKNILADFEISMIKNNINKTKKRSGLSWPAFTLY